MHWEEQRKAMQADMGNKAELARCASTLCCKQAAPEPQQPPGSDTDAMPLQRPCIRPTARHGAAAPEAGDSTKESSALVQGAGGRMSTVYAAASWRRWQRGSAQVC